MLDNATSGQVVNPVSIAPLVLRVRCSPVQLGHTEDSSRIRQPIEIRTQRRQYPRYFSWCTENKNVVQRKYDMCVEEVDASHTATYANNHRKSYLTALLPRRVGQKAGAVPKIAHGQGHPRFISGVARGAVKCPSVVPRDVSCTKVYAWYRLRRVVSHVCHGEYSMQDVYFV